MIGRWMVVWADRQRHEFITVRMTNFDAGSRNGPYIANAGSSRTRVSTKIRVYNANVQYRLDGQGNSDS